jgi:DHA2 family multidrug resistance protein
MYIMTTFSPMSSQNDILFSLYVRGFGMAFLFVPINSSILSQFSGANLGQVSGLLNLFRQLGGSAGVALVATLLTTRSQQNYVDLTSKVSLLNTNTQTAYYPLVQGFGKKMTDNMGMATGHEAALKSIGTRIQNQVFMMSFNQLIWTMMFIFALAFIPWYFMELKRKVTGPIDSH